MLESNTVVPFPLSDISTTSRASALPAAPAPSPTSVLSPGSIHKEVGQELLERERKHHRKKGAVPYPLQYTSLNLNFDSVDHLILKDIYDGLTLRPVCTPPKRVLDLGCGGGLWILAAAQQWTESTFVGFDIHRRQPNLARAGQGDLAKRVSWVHGNFLEVLPFLDEEFDFARIQNIGLGVPEDEWQNVIEEIVRVLKPGGTLEIIEEDLIFPCPDTPVTRTPRASPILRGRITQRSNGRSAGEAAFREDDDDFDEILSDLFPSNRPRSVTTLNGEQQDQRDHSKLKEAFLQMLSSRFINPQVLTVLPFYLQAAFEEVHTMPIVKLRLPRPSAVDYNSDLSDDASHFSLDSSDNTSQLSLSSSSATLVNSSSSSPSSSIPRRISDASSTSSSSTLDGSVRDLSSTELLRARLYLSRTIETVRGCKEAIWAEYEKLHYFERITPNSRLDRDDFEMYFYNWECDMQDRSGMRSAVCSNLGWAVPRTLPKPQWYEWRQKGDSDDVASFYASAKLELLRSLRGFVCRTPMRAVNGH